MIKGKPIYVLGIYDGHCATATLLRDGEIISSVSEERFVGKKNYSGFPRHSIEYLIKSENISPADLAMVVLPLRWGVPVFNVPEVKHSDTFLKIATTLYSPLWTVRNIVGYLEYKFPALHPISRFLYELAFRIVGSHTVNKNREYIASQLGIEGDKVRAYEHHASHAACAYYGSSYNRQNALVLTIDGEGDLLSATVNTVRNGKWKRLAETKSDCSLGYIYHEVTGYLGMKRNEHEYKVMGLAPYAKEYGVLPLYERIKDLVVLDPKNPLKFKAKFDTHLVPGFLKKELIEQRFDYIAGAFQKLVEDRLSEWVRNAAVKTGIGTVCASGGVIMNVKANLKIAELPQVKRFFPCPSSGDESSPIGACYLGYLDYCREYKIKPSVKPLGSLYWGPSFTNQEIQNFLKKNNYDKKYKIDKLENIEEKIAQLLSAGKIVARLAGRMEWGARALGNRSILANPKNPDLVRIINEQMKMRDFWMPFAPSILAERSREYIVNHKKIPAPYMILTFHSTPKAQRQMRAAMHPYDFTIRPQLVEKSWNPEYYKILKEFEKITGIGGVLNTSFNLHGFPIVLGPKEAMYAFENSGLEYLALENYLISKR